MKRIKKQRKHAAEEPASSAQSFPELFRKQIAETPPESLRANPRNARTHSRKQIRQLVASINASGFLGTIVIDEDRTVLAGHARWEAAKLAGLSHVTTIQVFGLSEVQKRAFAIADNKIAANAGWDRNILVGELADLIPMFEALEWDISLTGFEGAEIDALFGDLTTEVPEPADDLPPLEKRAVSKPGDLWILGRHRLICANARSHPELDRLMNGAKANMVCADVPYNQKVSEIQGRGRIKHPEFHEASGEQTSPEYIEFLTATLGNAARASREGAVHYVFHDWRHSFELHAAGHAVYGTMLNLCVWAKTCAGQGSFYRSQHEFIGVFQVGRNGHQNNICLGRFGRNRSNLWTYAGMSGFGAERMELLAMHPTVKPVPLIVDAMRDCTTRGDIVLDPFIGSGTTILAAEKVGRRGYGVEYETRYVDVAIRRWEAFTKAEAVLDGDGRTFEEVKADRLKQSPRNKPLAAAGGSQ